MVEMSLPSWECGLKFFTQQNHVEPLLSLPSWECGLKYKYGFCIRICVLVTPFVGVWIEILNPIVVPLLKIVTPFVGVWIEIAMPGSLRWSSQVV